MIIKKINYYFNYIFSNIIITKDRLKLLGFSKDIIENDDIEKVRYILVKKKNIINY